MDRHRTRAIFALILTTVSWVVAATPALADTPLTTTGKVGAHSLNDDVGDWGAICNYDGPDNHIVSWTINAPNVYARNKSSGVDQQKVGWRYIVKRQADGSSKWVTVKKSSIVKKKATDKTPAAFTDRTNPFKYEGDSYSYVVVIKMFWYRPDGSVAGSATNQVDHYAEMFVNPDDGPYNQSTCFGRGF